MTLADVCGGSAKQPAEALRRRDVYPNGVRRNIGQTDVDVIAHNGDDRVVAGGEILEHVLRLCHAKMDDTVFGRYWLTDRRNVAIDKQVVMTGTGFVGTGGFDF